MKPHRPLFLHIVSALKQIFALQGERGFHADKVIERLFQTNRKLGARDRRFIAEATYDIVRWWRLLAFCADSGASEIGSETELWRILGAWFLIHDRELPDWPEFRNLNAAEIQKRHNEAQAIPAVRESVPDWLYELGRDELGESKWHEVLRELNHQAPVVLRANRLKINREKLMTELAQEGVETVYAPGTEDGLVLKERKNVFTTIAFKQGYFEVQDGASQQAAVKLAPLPGERVIDACAGAGGKSLHLAALMGNKGKIIAMDVHAKKLEELRKRASRAGADIIETRLIDSTKVIKRLEKSADRVLLDVPCSGLGVVRRNPDTKWKLTALEIERLRQLQREILSSYSRMLKPGGRLVYATCSILPSENSKQVEWFLSSHSDTWKLLEQTQYWPGENGYDGFYVAVLERVT